MEKTNLLWKRKFSDVVSRARAPADDESSEDEEMKDKSSEDEEIPRRRKRIKLLEETQDKPKSNVEMVGTSTSSDSKEDTDEKMPTNNALMLRDSGVSSVSVTSNTFTLMGFIRSENFKTYMDKKLQDFSGEALSQVEVKSTGQTVPQKYSHYSFIVVAFNNNKKRSRQAQAPRMDANRPWKLAALKETNQIEHIFSNAKEQQELTAAVFAAFRYALEYDLKQIKSIEGDRLRSYKRSRSDFENDEVTMTYSGQSALDNTDVVLIDHDIQSTGIRLHVVIPGQELSRTEENNIAMLYAKFIKVIIDEMAKAQCDGCEKLSEYGVNVSFEPAILNMS